MSSEPYRKLEGGEESTANPSWGVEKGTEERMGWGSTMHAMFSIASVLLFPPIHGCNLVGTYRTTRINVLMICIMMWC